jgi:integration host factor subunit beta
MKRVSAPTEIDFTHSPPYTISADTIWLEGKGMPTKTKKDLIDRIGETTNCKRTVVKTVVREFLDEIVSEVAKGNRLEFRDFGVFEPHVCAPRTAQNPKTLEPIDVPARQVVKFKMGRGMREGMNGNGKKR